MTRRLMPGSPACLPWADFEFRPARLNWTAAACPAQRSSPPAACPPGACRCDVRGCGGAICRGGLHHSTRPRPEARPAGGSAGVAGSGRNLAVDRRRQVPRGRGSGPQGRMTGPAPERTRLRLGRLVHGPGAARGAGLDDRRRPRLRAGPGDFGPGPPAMCRAQAAYRGTAHPRPRRGHPDPLGPGPAADPATAGAGTTAGGRAGAPGPVAGGGPGDGCAWTRRCASCCGISCPAGTIWCAASTSPRSPPPPTGWKAGLAASSPGPASRGG